MLFVCIASICLISQSINSINLSKISLSFFYLFIYLSIVLSIYLFVYLSVCLSVCLPACLAVCLFVYLSIYINYLPQHSIHLFIHVSIPSISPSPSTYFCISFLYTILCTFHFIYMHICKISISNIWSASLLIFPGGACQRARTCPSSKWSRNALRVSFWEKFPIPSMGPVYSSTFGWFCM